MSALPVLEPSSPCVMLVLQTVDQGALQCRAFQILLGDIKEVLNAFRSFKTLIEIPKAWRQALESSPGGSCWYPAHISCQVCIHNDVTRCMMSLSAAQSILSNVSRSGLITPCEKGCMINRSAE